MSYTFTPNEILQNELHADRVSENCDKITADIFSFILEEKMSRSSRSEGRCFWPPCFRCANGTAGLLGMGVKADNSKCKADA